MSTFADQFAARGGQLAVNTDPFAGIPNADDTGTYLDEFGDRQTTALELVWCEVHGQGHALTGECRHPHFTGEYPAEEGSAVPLGDVLAPYEQRRADRKATTTTTLNVQPPAKPNPQQTAYGVAILFGLGALGREKHVYGGTVPAWTVTRRRAKNRAARRSRRVNRLAGTR